MAGVTFDLDALERVAEANRRVPDVLRQKMTAASQQIIVPAFQQEMRRRGRGQQKRILIPGSYATAGFSGYTLYAGLSREILSGGGEADELARPFEFGTSKPTKRTYASRRRGGRAFVVHDRVTTNQLPARASKGWVVYPSGAAILKRAAPLWVQVAVKVLADAMEGT